MSPQESQVVTPSHSSLVTRHPSLFRTSPISSTLRQRPGHSDFAKMDRSNGGRLCFILWTSASTKVQDGLELF